MSTNAHFLKKKTRKKQTVHICVSVFILPRKIPITKQRIPEEYEHKSFTYRSWLLCLEGQELSGCCEVGRMV